MNRSMFRPNVGKDSVVHMEAEFSADAGVAPDESRPRSASGGTPFGAAALPGAGSSPPYNLYQFGLDASWEVDIWGHARRGVEAATASAQASYEDRNAILLSARAEHARDDVQLRDTLPIL
jgi:outer membrane protein TolC